MSSLRSLSLFVGLLATWTTALGQPVALTSALTYQGELRDAGGPYTGSADFRLALFNEALTGSQVGPSLTRANVAVSGGRFTLSDLDFGSAPFTASQARWLSIEVRTPHDPTNSAPYTLLTPRQPMTSAPFSLWAGSALSAANASNAGTLNGLTSAFYRDATNLNAGTLPAARLGGVYSNTLTLNNASNSIAGTFTGIGTGLAALNASNLASGTVADPRLSGNIPRLDAAANLFAGSLHIGAPGGNALSAIGPGSATGGVPGFNEVVARLRNTTGGSHTALTIDGQSGQDAVLYLAENGAPAWGLRSDADQNHEFQLRLHAGGQNLTLWGVDAGGNMGVGTRPVSSARLTVSGLIATTSGGVVFPDGTVQRTAAANNPVPLAVATYPAGTTITITLGGSPCSLETPVATGLDVIESVSGTGTFLVAPGAPSRLPFKVSRPRSANNDWLTIWNNTVANGWNTSGQNLVISRTQSGSPASVVFTMTGLQASGYEVKPDGLGGVREVLSLEPPTSIALVPTYTNGGFATGTLSQPTELAALISATALTNVEPIGLSRSAEVSQSTVGQTVVADIQRIRTPSFVLRAPFGCNSALRDWTNSLFQGALTRRTLTLSSGATTIYTSSANRAFVHLYRIVQAHDGSVYEEYSIAADGEP